MADTISEILGFFF